MYDYTLIQKIVLFAVPALLAITLHEATHGYVARLRGDRTAEMLGRLTLNPLKHVDPVGTVIVPLAMLLASYATLAHPVVFGWAKPVPVGYRNLRNPRRDMALVAAAGPSSNLVMALGWGLFIRVLLVLQPVSDPAMHALVAMALFGIEINAVLAVLNMLPVPPLDGGRVVTGLLPPRLALRFGAIEPYGMLIVIGLLVTGLLWPLLQPGILAVRWLVATLLGLS